MNDTLMDQCRREAEDRYPITVVKEPGGGEYFFVQCKCSFVFLSRDADGCHPIADSGDHSEMRCPSCGIIAEDECYDTNVINAARATYAAALYAERSKRPPMISVEDAKHVWVRFIQDMNIHIPLYKEVMDAFEQRLTAAATNNTNDNG